MGGETIDPLLAWAEDVLCVLGQMTHERGVEGRMLLVVEQRRELITRGHKLLGYPGFEDE